MAIVRAYTEAHGDNVHVENIMKKGLTFMVDFPAMPDENAWNNDRDQALVHMGMQMYKICSAIIFSFFLMSCASMPSVLLEGKEVRNLFMQAQKQESLKNYAEAAKTYSSIAKNYPGAINYPTAVLKAAMLYSHPDNPDINFKKSLYWFETYRSLLQDFSEKEVVSHQITLIKYCKDLQEKNSQLKDTINKMKEVDIQLHETKIKD